jgi:hypothetical protein
MTDGCKTSKAGPATTAFGPGYGGNTQSSPATDTPLPSKVNEGDAGVKYVKEELHGKNSTSEGTTAGVQSQASVNRPRGTRGSGTTANHVPYGK